jgi:hypothetical protein
MSATWQQAERAPVQRCETQMGHTPQTSNEPNLTAGRALRVSNKLVENRVLLANAKTCCVCRDPRRPVHVHHINGNATLTTDRNLAVLCLDHHDEATAALEKGRTGLSRKLTPALVRGFKSSWEGRVAAELSVPKPVIAWQERRQLQALMQFELVKWKAELFYENITAREIDHKFHYLENFAIEEYITGVKYRRPILRALRDVALTCLDRKTISLRLIKMTRNLTGHLFDPKQVPITGEDKFILRESLHVLDIVGDYGAWLEKNVDVLQVSCVAICELAAKAKAYRLLPLVSSAEALLKKLREECCDYDLDRELTESRRRAGIQRRIEPAFPRSVSDTERATAGSRPGETIGWLATIGACTCSPCANRSQHIGNASNFLLSGFFDTALRAGVQDETPQVTAELLSKRVVGAAFCAAHFAKNPLASLAKSP